MQLQKKIGSERSWLPDLAFLNTGPFLSERCVVLAGRRVKVRLETMVWDGLDEVARREGRTVGDLCGKLNRERGSGVSLATAIRTYVLHHFRKNPTDQRASVVW